MRSPSRALPAIVFAATLLVSACHEERAREGDLGDVTGAEDLAPQPDLGRPIVPCDSGVECGDGGLCYLGGCIPDRGGCAVDDDCIDDSYCDCVDPLADAGSADGGDGDAGTRGPCGRCVPWGRRPRGDYNPTCREPPFDVADVSAPALVCASGNDVETTPLVVDLDRDGRVEVVYTDIGYGFHAMHGDDCSPVWDRSFGFSEWNASELAAADLDGDGKAEIVGVDRTHRPAVFDAGGNVMASAPMSYDFTDGSYELGGPSIADLDNHAPPEILVGGQVLRYTHAKDPLLTQLWMLPVTPAFWGTLAIAADLDGDSRPEIISGRQILDAVKGDDKTPAALANLDGPGAYSAIADFNGDGKPDLVWVQSGSDKRRILVYDLANQAFLFGPLDVAEAWGGPPTVADYDGDGKPEFSVAGIHALTIYDLACLANPRPTQCEQGGAPGILWHREIHDSSSGACGSVAFDLNGDGAAEAIYRDECWLRAYDGRTGKTLFAWPAPSATGLDLPVVADVNDDGHAEILVSASGFPQCDGTPEPDTGTPWDGKTLGVIVLTDPRRRWMPARPLWNQHAYHITNIQDDLSVPPVETNSWAAWNSYRTVEQGIAGRPAGIPDFTARETIQGGAGGGPMDCADHWSLSAEICNRGAGTAFKGIRGTFYRDDPRKGGSPICTGVTGAALLPGECQPVSCDWKSPDTFIADLWFRADDDGHNARLRGECKGTNDLLFMEGATCKTLQ